MSKYTIRRATAKDASPLISCIDAAYSRYLDRGIKLPPVSQGIEQDIADNIVWVAEQNGWIIGGLVLIIHSDNALPDTAKLANIVVHPSAGGKGIGRALIQICEAHVMSLGLHELQLATHKDMPDNVELYAHLGWQITGSEGDKIYMNKLLRS